MHELVPIFAYQLSNDKAQEEQPILYQGVFYFADHDATMAVDARTGKQLWKNQVKYPDDLAKEICCGQISRGVAVYDGVVYRNSLDDNVYAYDAKSGKQLWKQNVFDYKQGYAMTGAPTVAGGVLVTGIAGAEYGARDFIDGWDPKTGKHLWRTYTPACAPDPGGDTWGPGDACKRGGGSTWITGSYDPELDLVYWGVGNAGSWYVADRPGDNLYTSSVIAFHPKDGKVVWHYQFSPHEGMDFDGVNEMVLTTLKVEGKPTKVLLHADRNSFFYVIDRTNGHLIQAFPFAKQNWAEKIDLQTGRPVLTQAAKDYYAGKPEPLWPFFYGGKNWSPMSYDHKTGLVLHQHPQLRVQGGAEEAGLSCRRFLFRCRFPRPGGSARHDWWLFEGDRTDDRQGALVAALLHPAVRWGADHGWRAGRYRIADWGCADL